MGKLRTLYEAIRGALGVGGRGFVSESRDAAEAIARKPAKASERNADPWAHVEERSPRRGATPPSPDEAFNAARARAGQPSPFATPGYVPPAATSADDVMRRAVEASRAPSPFSGGPVLPKGADPKDEAIRRAAQAAREAPPFSGGPALRDNPDVEFARLRDAARQSDEAAARAAATRPTRDQLWEQARARHNDPNAAVRRPPSGNTNE